MERARIGKYNANPKGGEYVKDPKTGELTGILIGTAGERIKNLLPPDSRARKLIGARGALTELSRCGITTIHDITRVDEISQKKIFHTHVERFFSDLNLFLDLRDRGELTVRVYPILTLAVWREILEHGIEPGSGDEMIRYGALKAFVDGTFMFEPYADNPNYSGNFTFRVVDEATMERDIVGADSAGFDIAIHVIGDKAHHLLLNWYEYAIKKNPPRDRRFRLIRADYPSLGGIRRAGRIKLIADIQPVHLIRDFKGIEKKIGPQRAKTAHAWRTMLDSGIMINLSSDWPRSFHKYRMAIKPVNPMEIIYYAVTRQDLNGYPPGGWHPEQRMTVEEAIKAYTFNPAYSSHEEDIKGTITEGKLADLIVLSKDILSVEPREILSTEVLYTVFDGKIIYKKDN